MAHGWIGNITLGDNWAAFAGTGADTPMHEHLAFKVAVGLDGPLRVCWADGAAAELEGPVALIRPQQCHALRAGGRRVVLFFIEPHALAQAEGAQLAACLPHIAEAAAHFDAQGDATPLAGLARALTLASAPLPRKLARARSALAAADGASIGQAAAAAGWSESRLSHAFRQQMGVAPARFRRWARLRQATLALARGLSITDAALDAGFSDAAHLTRTFTEMLGISPGTFRASTLRVLPPPAD